MEMWVCWLVISAGMVDEFACVFESSICLLESIACLFERFFCFAATAEALDEELFIGGVFRLVVIVLVLVEIGAML